jgi:hypothetical protein
MTIVSGSFRKMEQNPKNPFDLENLNTLLILSEWYRETEIPIMKDLAASYEVS